MVVSRWTTWCENRFRSDFTVALIVGVCCAAVVVKLVVVAVFCARHKVALGVGGGTSSGAHKAGSQPESGPSDKAAATTSSVWKRLHADRRADAVIPASCSVSVVSPCSLCSRADYYAASLSASPRGDF